MKITFVISSLQAGGAEKVLTELANHFAKKHTVTIITFEDNNKTSFYPVNDAIKIVRLNLLKNESTWFRKIIHFIRRVFVLRATFKSIKSDIIISFMDVTNVTAILANLFFNTPIIVSERTNPFHYQIPKLYNFLRKYTYKFATSVVVQNNSTAKYFKKNKNIIVIPNAVNASLALCQIKKDVLNIVSVGRLDTGKDFKTLILAFKNISTCYPRINLTIFGEGKERYNLELLIQSQNLNERVFLPGNDQNVTNKLHNFDLFVFPSRYEGFPNALCEAMSSGLPIIASNCSGSIDIVEDTVNGRSFPIGNVENLSKILKELINDYDQRIRLSQNAVKISSVYSQDKIYTQWANLIKI